MKKRASKSAKAKRRVEGHPGPAGRQEEHQRPAAAWPRSPVDTYESTNYLMA